MELFIAFLLLLGGAIIGFFASRSYYKPDSAEDSAQLSARDQLTLLAQQHVEQSKALLHNIESQASELREQLSVFESELQNDEPEKEQPQLAFFGDQASAYLRSAEAQNKRNKSTTEDQPLDYSGASSGLFTGVKNQQTNSTE